MKTSTMLAAPIQAGAALRHRRLFHPSGVLADGTVERLAAPGEGLPVESGPVVARVSKGLGTPGALPDFAGLAWRMSPAPFAATPWDVLLVSAGIAGVENGPPAMVNRLALRPVTSWAQAPYSSLMPLQYQGKLWWLRALLRTPVRAGGLSLDAIRGSITEGSLEFEIEQACGTEPFEPLALITLDGPHAKDMAFDPVLHSAPDVTLWPQWLRDLRELAYDSSREGRATD